MRATSAPSARDAAILARVARRVGTAAGVFAVTVPNGATSVAVTFATPQPNAAYAVLLAPSYGTTAWASALTRTGFTLNLGTAAPGAQSCTCCVVLPDA